MVKLISIYSFLKIYFSAYELLDAAGRYDIKSLKVYTGRCKFYFSTSKLYNSAPSLSSCQSYQYK